MTQHNSGQNCFIRVGKFAIRMIVVKFKNRKPDFRVTKKQIMLVGYPGLG